VSEIITITQSWIKDFIIKETICPFASVPFIQDKIHYIVSQDQSVPEQLQQCLSICMQMHSDHSITTAFFILDNTECDFEELLDLKESCSILLGDYNLDLEFQLVPFHPNFIFEGCNSTDPINETNRSPYPMIHILRESDVTQAVAIYGDITSLLENNKITTKRLFGK